MGKVALPELRRYRYSGALATGTLAAGGVLGILIPPSVVLIIYAIIVEANIVTMFMAALLPGLMAVALFLLTIAVYVAIWPSAGPRGGTGDRAEFVAASLGVRSEEHTSELQSLMRISYAVFCLKKKKNKYT